MLRSTPKPRPQRSGVLLLAVAVLLCAAGCASDGAPASQGNTSDVAPRRIVSLTPSLTETLFALGLGERVVGVTSFCDWPPEAASLPKVGGYSNPSPESVLALEPDLVVVSPNAGNREAALAMERAGTRLLVVEGDGLDDTYRVIQTVADACGVPDRGRELTAEIRSRVAAAGDAIAGREAVPVLYCVQMDPIIAVGSETLTDQLIALAGGRNVLQAGGYPRLGIEAVIDAAPQVIIQTTMGGADDDVRIGDFWDGWPSIPAIATDRLHVIDGTTSMRPGPRLGAAVEELARLLHPQAFPADRRAP